jgi:hypothetical protein
MPVCRRGGPGQGCWLPSANEAQARGILTRIMPPERWRQIEDVFHAALECEPAVRHAFLEDACRGDEALRREVEAPLQQDAQDGELLSQPNHTTAFYLPGTISWMRHRSQSPATALTRIARASAAQLASHRRL